MPAGSFTKPTIGSLARLYGAPRSMKMGTTRSPWRYEAGAVTLTKTIGTLAVECLSFFPSIKRQLLD
jgi:hypothetical protein